MAFAQQQKEKETFFRHNGVIQCDMCVGGEKETLKAQCLYLSSGCSTQLIIWLSITRGTVCFTAMKGPPLSPPVITQ